MSTTLPQGTAAAPATAPAASSRIPSVDIIRGAVMILMAIDHVRVYSGLPAGGPTPGIFFTRWITHFCAPAFILLAGTSAFLSGAKRGTSEISRHLLIRGAWLVLLELTVLRVGWTFNLDFAHYLLAGVIWCIGWCMILMAGLVRLPVRWIGIIGLVIIAGHNLVDPHLGQLGQSLRGSSMAWLLQALYFGGPIQLGAGGPPLIVLYSIIPWIGVMAAGYAFGTVLAREEVGRWRLCLMIGCGATALFLVLRGFNLYGNPWPWTVAPGSPGPQVPALLRFLNTNKYPASLSFLLMTLGPTIALMPLLDHARGWLARVLTVFGRVPFFYYVLHIPLIHLFAVAVSWLRQGTVNPWLFGNHPMAAGPAPDGYTWSLGLLYVVWAVALVPLYLASKWFMGVKSRRKEAWLRYL